MLNFLYEVLKNKNIYHPAVLKYIEKKKINDNLFFFIYSIVHKKLSM